VRPADETGEIATSGTNGTANGELTGAGGEERVDFDLLFGRGAALFLGLVLFGCLTIGNEMKCERCMRSHQREEIEVNVGTRDAPWFAFADF